jgi:hypothetical protein
LALFYVLNLTPALCIEETQLRKACLEFMSSEIEIDFWKTDIIPTLKQNADDFLTNTILAVRQLHTIPEMCRGQAEQLAVERITATWKEAADGIYADAMKKREGMLFSLMNVVLANAKNLLDRLRNERESAPLKMFPVSPRTEEEESDDDLAASEAAKRDLMKRKKKEA